jgi:hypothetical protein
MSGILLLLLVKTMEDSNNIQFNLVDYFYADRVYAVQFEGSGIGCGTLGYSFVRPASFFLIHHYFGVILDDSSD